MADRVRDDPPEYDPGAEAQRIAGEFADAAREYATDEARDAAAEAWFEGRYGPFGTS